MTTPDDTAAHNYAAQMAHTGRVQQPTKKRTGATPEAKVLKACIAYLESLGCYVARTGAGLVAVGGRTISMGRTGGLDLTICMPNGCYCAVDAKSEKGTPSAAQLRQAALIEERGGTALFPHSVDELRAGLCRAYGPQRVVDWEAAGRARAAAKKDAVRAVRERNR